MTESSSPRGSCFLAAEIGHQGAEIHAVRVRFGGRGTKMDPLRCVCLVRHAVFGGEESRDEAGREADTVVSLLDEALGRAQEDDSLDSIMQTVGVMAALIDAQFSAAVAVYRDDRAAVASIGDVNIWRVRGRYYDPVVRADVISVPGSATIVRTNQLGQRVPLPGQIQARTIAVPCGQHVAIAIGVHPNSLDQAEGSEEPPDDIVAHLTRHWISPPDLLLVFGNRIKRCEDPG